MRVLLVGASGMIGSALRRELDRQGHETRLLTRAAGGDYLWDARPGSVPPEAITWAQGVISLNGASLNHLPWTASYRRLIESSRVYPSTALAQAIAESSDPPQVWVSGSAIGIYGDAGDQILDETAPPGETFLADVVQKWEAATETARAHTRVVLARTGIVLARDGALRPLGLATRFGFGARIGPGTQWWGWISLIDEVRALIHALEMDSIVGPVNLVAPQPVQANDITRTLAKVLHRPHALVLPSPLIRLAMAGADELLLNSQRVHPQTLLTTNFPFHHPDLQTAITATQ